MAGKPGYVVRAAALAVMATWGLGCNLDRSGLSVSYLVPDGGASDIAGGDDVRDAHDKDLAPDLVVTPDATVDAHKDVAIDLVPDVPPDVGRDAPVDVERDAPSDVPVPCDPSSHRCGSDCVSNTSTQSCGTSCTPCPVPTNGTATCNGTSCGLACNTGFTLQGSTCLACNAGCDVTATTVTAPGGRFSGKTVNTSANAGSCGGGAAPEAVFRLVLTQPADVFVTTHGTSFDTVLYMRRGTCCGAEVACNDDADGRTTSVLSQPNLPAGTYYIFVDGARAGELGDYTVDIYTSAPSTTPAEACGRPVRIADQAVSGNTCILRNDYDPPPGCIDVTNSSFDAVYYFVLDTRSTVTFSTCNATCIDSILYIRDVCTVNDPQSACNDDDNSCGVDMTCSVVAGVPSTVSTTLDPGVHYLVLDTYPNPMPTLCGAYAITPAGVPP